MKTLFLALFVLGFTPLVGVAQPGESPVTKVDAKEYSLGETDARRDLMQGKTVYEILGQPSMIDRELQKIALKDYGITVKFHGCTRGPRVDYDQGYLDTVVAHLKKKHGFDPVLKVERELREKSGGPAPAPKSKPENTGKPQTAQKPESQRPADASPSDKAPTEYGVKTASTITVRITGPAVRKPGIYHLGADTSFGTLIKMAELLRLSNGRFRVLRTVDGHEVEQVVNRDQTDFPIRDGDVIYAEAFYEKRPQ